MSDDWTPMSKRGHRGKFKQDHCITTHEKNSLQILPALNIVSFKCLLTGCTLHKIKCLSLSKK